MPRIILLVLSVLFLNLAPAHADEIPHIVIFWASIGQGHKSAAEGIAADVRVKYPAARVTLKDIREFLSAEERELSGSVYDTLTKHFPTLYDASFRLYLKAGAEPGSLPWLPAMKTFHGKEVGEWLTAQDPTVVVSTFNHATEVLISLKTHGQLTGVPLAWQHTDYVPKRYFVNLSRFLDMTFLPHDRLRKYWMDNGIRGRHVMTTGMPLNPLVHLEMTEGEKHAFLKSKGLRPGVTTISLMGGSAGVGKFTQQVDSIAEAIDGPLQIAIMAGKNEAQKEKLREMAAEGLPRRNVKLVILGSLPQPDVFRFLKVSDVFVTKSGGLTPTEAAMIGVPMVLLDINGGQERFNAALFRQVGLALSTADQTLVGELALRILREPGLKKKMLEQYAALRGMMRPSSIADWVLWAADVTDPATDKRWAKPPVELPTAPALCAEKLSEIE